MEKFDLILKNASVVDLENHTIVQCDVGIIGDKIAALAKGLSGNTQISCDGKYVVPGFIDAHVHVESSMALPSEFGRAVIKCGTTAIVADPHEIVNVGGVAALDAFLQSAKKSPADIFTVVPSSVPATPFDTNGAGEFLASDMKKYVGMPEIVGLGEVMCYEDLLSGKQHILDKIALFKDKTIDGHSAGLATERLADYRRAGVQNDHESNDYADAYARYAAGLNVYIREGSCAKNLESIVNGVLKDGLQLSKFAFCTDDKHLSDIVRDGHISYNVRRAVALGMDPFDALSLASKNPAAFYKLQGRGEIKVGYLADILVVDSLTDFNVLQVIKSGEIYVDAGDHLNEAFLTDSVKFRPLTVADLTIADRDEYTVIGLNEGSLLTEKLSTRDISGLNKAVCVERYGKNGNRAVAYVSGYNISSGAVATSVSHDSHNVIAVGDNDLDITLAVNHLLEIGGGYAVASKGCLVDELVLDVGGLMSSKDYVALANDIARVEQTVHLLGVPQGIDVYESLSFMALPVIPFVRLMDSGLFDVVTGRFID